jgi:hypothetical protein
MIFTSFHQFLYGFHQFVNYFVVVCPDAIGYAGLDMIAEQFFIEGVKRRLDRGYLYKDIPQ